MSATTIVPVPLERQEELQPLWRALYDHHSSLTPHLDGRLVPFERSWERRRELERHWLESEPHSFLIAAEQAGRYVGYAFVRVRSGAGYSVSWEVSDPLAELATLVVLPTSRGQGVGSLLMDRVEERLRELEVADMTIDVITTNTDAIRLYERRGAAPFVVELLHRVGRSAER
jgi:ribosomal protein S18 acetylase RimI-like enzyme